MTWFVAGLGSRLIAGRLAAIAAPLRRQISKVRAPIEPWLPALSGEIDAQPDGMIDIIGIYQF